MKLLTISCFLIFIKEFLINLKTSAAMKTEDFQARNNDYFKSTQTKLDISIETATKVQVVQNRVGK